MKNVISKTKKSGIEFIIGLSLTAMALALSGCVGFIV
jgi:preprotein translocase subunit Sss1